MRRPRELGFAETIARNGACPANLYTKNASLRIFDTFSKTTFATLSANNRHQPVDTPPKRVWHCCLIRRAASYGRDLRAMPQEPLSRVERRLERVRFSWTSGKRAVASAVAIADSQ
jgi:hypothetical protein